MARSAKPRIRGFKSRSRLFMLQKLQAFLATRQKFIIKLFVVVEIALVVTVFALGYLAFNDPRGMSWIFVKYGSLLGQIALVLFMIALLPGIMQRLRLFPKVTMPLASIIIIFRRHIGILMFLTAWAHMTFTTTLPRYLFTGTFLPSTLPMLFEMMGTLAFMVLFPVWVTSNDFSKRLLGKWWKTLQRLTYIAIWFIVAHVVLLGGSTWVIVAISTVALLEVTSWIVHWRRPVRVVPPAAPVTPVAPTTPQTPPVPPATI